MEDLKMDEKFIKGSYTISLDIAGRRIQIGGYIKEGDDKQTVIAAMTEMQECIDHQLIRADLKSQEGQLRGELAALETLVEEHEKLVKKQGELRPGKRLIPQEEAKLRGFIPTADQYKLSIATRKRIISENRKTLGLEGDGTAVQ